ncbi:hypothetical protein PsAD5_02526 [Pseudovibrio sp. Ad5]|uniref:hypothetical protein n=1 Tax=Pseudovibrio sp. Ad5 TaxID=989436 RepID=UPI0007AEA0BE|nr:hypothetical protein [Pseudovibrio sp. Ad5]KZK96339.1 hypothetical protein PsAD5_02526 [Pseudovibrio sp. Ad5]
MRTPNRTRGEVACTFNGHDLILCAQMQALDQIDAELDLAISEIMVGLQKRKLSVVKSCARALTIEGDIEEALRTKVGVLGIPELADSIVEALVPDAEEADAAGKGSATGSD